MEKLRSLSIFFPSLNDAKILPYLVCKAHKAAENVTEDFEIIVINDGSEDDTFEVLESLKNVYPHLKTIHHSRNQGYGGALISGFKISKKEWVFYTDGDGQYDPLELSKLVEKVNKNIDVVNGYKKNRSDNKIRTFMGGMYNIFLHHIYTLPISDIDCDFRLIRRKVINKVHLKFNSGMICLELVVKLQKVGAQFTEVAVNHYPRQFGKSQFFKLAHLLRAAKDNIKFFFYAKRGVQENF